MWVEPLTIEIIPSLQKLAREVEPLFEVPMADNKGFYEFIRRKISQYEALMVRDAEHFNELMGLITFSYQNSSISWFAVFKKHKGKGIGSKLLERAINQLGNKREISVITFCENNELGLPARKLYRKFGFQDFYPNYYHNGLFRCVMKRPPRTFYTKML